MAVKAVTKKTRAPPKQGAPQAKPAATEPQPQPGEAQAGQADPPKKAAVPTVTENEAHHATLQETKCSDCVVGLLKQYTSESLRAQKKLDPTNQKYHLQDNEEIEFLRAKPLTLQFVGLRRERSISNKFDDLLIVLYDPALLKEGEKTVLEDPELRPENLANAQGFVDKILSDKDRPPLKNWPLPGTDVSCLQCMHWRVLTFPITTEPGYDPKAPHTKKDAQGKQLPNFDDLSLLPDEVGAVAPGIYNNSYRVGLHLGARKPPNSFAALQLILDSIPARRRYPIGRFLKRAESAFNKGTDDDIRKALIRKDAKAQKELIASIQEEFKEMKRGTKAEKAAFDKAVKKELDTRNRESYAPKLLELRTNAAKAVLNALKARIGGNERYIRLEAPSGAETQDFDKEGNQVSSMEVADDDTSPIRVCVRLVFKSPPPTSSPSTAVGASATTPPPPRTLTLTKDDVLVTFGTAAGTNMHRSAREEGGAWGKNREVNNWSEGCQVFRSPNDFRHFMRMAMLSKRVHCPSRTDKCCAKLTVEDVEKGIGANMTAYISGCPDEFAKSAEPALRTGFSPPTSAETSAPNEPKAAATPDSKRLREAVEKLFAESKSHQEFTSQVEKAYWKQFPSEKYYNKNTYSLLQNYAREKVLSALSDKSTEEDIKKAADASIEEFTKKLIETKDAWVKSNYAREIEDRYEEYLVDGLEPCDFGTCGFKFDYMLAETTRTNMEAFVSKLGDRDWNSLYPQDASPPAPKPPKPAVPRVKSPAK
ncbi:hypothetical protein CYFUS_005165 [Cystobacter fuscus]|uniref:Uncharacterized protein n=1 Tax=Cystobacter fuscus TaxID=43 RepID=A0A250J865_9BACT|nr:hypothetical protein [Cystobacter fuscus]ATB39717.1 hypothetical protein CYFUS_005165 [Cystobacter fuscus]